MPDPARNPAADWLLAAYDDIDNPFRDLDYAQRGVLWRGVYVQPIFSLKNVLEAGNEMRVSARDYGTPGRWFL